MGRLAKAIGAMIGATMGAALSVAMAGTAQAAPPFRHILLVIQENRTVDNLFGSDPTFEPGVDIATSGVTSTGQVVALAPTPLAGCFDIGHQHADFEAMLTKGADQEALNPEAGCAVPDNAQFSYVDNSAQTVRPYFDIAASYGFANRMFQTNQGPSFPAHQFLFSGTSQPSAESPLFAAENKPKGAVGAYGCTAPPSLLVSVIDGYGDESSNAPMWPCYEHQTLGDVLDQAGIGWHYYTPKSSSIWTAPDAIAHMCAPALVKGSQRCEGTDYQNGSVQANNPAQVLTDIANCQLAAVSWVIPTGDESDHAVSNNGTGPAWVASIVNAVGQQQACPNGETYWDDTAIIITWDDWGGWYDHVAPFKIALQPGTKAKWGDGYTYGFRVPLLVVSAFTPLGYVDNKNHDFGSILYFVEQNFGLGFIGPGQQTYGDYADAQAAQRHDALQGFFKRQKPRLFKSIYSSIPASYFLSHAPTVVDPDDD